MEKDIDIIRISFQSNIMTKRVINDQSRLTSLTYKMFQIQLKENEIQLKENELITSYLS